jgi:hypothetical protein
MPKAKGYETVVFPEPIETFQKGEKGAVVEVYTTPSKAYDIEIDRGRADNNCRMPPADRLGALLLGVPPAQCRDGFETRPYIAGWNDRTQD